MRARRAEVAGRPWVRADAPQELHLDRHRKDLIESHRLGRLPAIHESIVAQGPFGSPGRLIADYAILGAERIVRKRRVVEQMPEFVVELLLVLGKHQCRA